MKTYVRPTVRKNTVSISRFPSWEATNMTILFATIAKSAVHGGARDDGRNNHTALVHVRRAVETIMDDSNDEIFAQTIVKRKHGKDHRKDTLARWMGLPFGRQTLQCTNVHKHAKDGLSSGSGEDKNG